MNNLNWYINLYYKFRDYPIAQLNTAYKPTELKSLYTGILKKMFLLFQIDNRRQSEIQGLISKNNYDLMINKRAETSLAQQQEPVKSGNQHQLNLSNNRLASETRLGQNIKRDTVSSFGSHNQQKGKEYSVLRESNSRWIVQSNPLKQNMDVFYELMIKMIRVSLRRLMVEAFAIDKYGKHISTDAISQIFKNHSQWTLKDKGSYSRKNDINNQEIEIVCFPSSTEELKFEFLSYCIKCKIYNNPTQLHHEKNHSVSSLNSSSNIEHQSFASIPSEIRQSIAQKQSLKKLNKASTNQIEGLIMKVSQIQTSIFNDIMDSYLDQLRKNGNNEPKVTGVKHISQSLFQMAFGAGHTNPNTSRPGKSVDYRRDMFENDLELQNSSGSLSSSNILLATWFDLILFKESPSSLFEIIQQLVRLQNKYEYLDDLEMSNGNQNQTQNKTFFYKMSAYHHLLILNSTKNLLVQSLCKINYLLIIFQDVLGQGQEIRRSFHEIKLQKYQQKVGSTTKVYDNILLTYDSKTKSNIWKKQAMQMLLAKWKIIANVITEVCVKNGKAFFASIFQKCVILLDRQLDIQVQLIDQLMNIAQSIKVENNGQINEKGLQTCQSLHTIIKEIIGYAQSVQHSNSSEVQDKLLNINNYMNSRSQQNRYKQSTFANREENTEELSKWTEIINQNIYVYSQYSNNLKCISKLFNNHSIYTALWFNKFHNQIKILMRKLQKDKLQTIFQKFSVEVSVLWDSMTADKQKPKNKNRFQRNDKFLRNRMSSIKSEKSLSLLQKKAIVLNYMVKAELQLYSHYMLINCLNSQRSINQFLSKQIGIKQQITSKPMILDHSIIRGLLLFTVEEGEEKQEICIDDNEFQLNFRRGYKRHKTSNFMNMNELDSSLKAQNQVEKKVSKTNIQDMAKVLSHFEEPMDIQLDLKQNWKEKFGESQIQYLSELNDYLRYINEINYLYQLWTWVESGAENRLSTQDQIDKKTVLELIDGRQYKQDLNEIDSIFQELRNNETLLQELLLIKGDSKQVLNRQHLSQMFRRIKMHNKELYMIIEAIIQGENYYKLLGNNLVGRDRNAKFKQILQDIIVLYKNNRREKPKVRMYEKIKQNLQYDPPLTQENPTPNTSTLVQSTVKTNTIPTSNYEPYVSKFNAKGGSFVSHFQFAPEYYKTQSKIFRLDCLIASFEVGNTIFKNIKHNHLLSKQRLQRLSIIGSKYYDKLQMLLAVDKGEETNEFSVNEQSLLLTKNIFEKKMLLVVVTLINLSYHYEQKVRRYTTKTKIVSDEGDFANIPEGDLRNYSRVLTKYSELLRKFIYWRIKENIKRMQERESFEKSNQEKQREQHKQFNVCRFLSQILELSDKNIDFTQDIFLLHLEQMIEKETNLKFSVMFKNTYEVQSEAVKIYQSEEEKVQYLRKKLSYLLMREMYFSLNYDNDFLEQKSTDSKRNYLIYEQRIFKFYEQIIHIDYQEYMQHKEDELKKRSIHLKNYQFKYEQAPPISSLEQNINQLICCLFNQLLTSYTTSVQYKMFKQNHKPVTQDSFSQQQLFQQYCASQYQKKEMLRLDKPKIKKKEQKDSIGSIFANMFFQEQKSPNSSSFNAQKQVKSKSSNIINVLIYTQQKFQLSQSVKIYLKILLDFDYSSRSERAEVNRNVNHNVFYSMRQEPLSASELQIIKTNERSLITMLKSQFLQRINEAKCNLILKHLISNIEKLYINLDVRHKVFQSFKDRILNYEMQKAKIYHQYMDYIRGLKLDVYSHMAGEQSLPYIKIIHAVKQYRLKIKKIELEKRVNQQFEKNLQKWNLGIQKNLVAYDSWLRQQQMTWIQKQQIYEQEKKNLFKIYHAVCKQMQRQSRPKKKTVISAKSIPNVSFVKTASYAETQEIRPVETEVAVINKVGAYSYKRMMTANAKPAQNSVRTTFYKQPQAIKPFIHQLNRPISKNSRLTYMSKSTSQLRGISLKYDLTHFKRQQQKQTKLKKNTIDI